MIRMPMKITLQTEKTKENKKKKKKHIQNNKRKSNYTQNFAVVE